MQNIRRIDLKSLVFYIIVITLTIGAVSAGTFELLIFAYVCLSMLLLFVSRELLIILYLITLLTNGYIPREEYIGGMLGVEQVVNIITLISLLSFNKVKFKLSKMGNSTPKKLSFNILLLLFLYISYTVLKEAYFSMNNTTLWSSLATIISTGIKFLPLFIILNRNLINIIIFQKGITLGIVNLMIFAIFSTFFDELGFYSQTLYNELYTRYGGVVGNGDVNTLGVILVMFIGHLFSRYEKEASIGLSNYILFLLAMLVIGMTASRAAFISIVLIAVIFLIRNITLSNIMGMLVFIVFITISGTYLFSNTLSRIDDISEEQLTMDSGASNRIGKWIYYFEDFNQKKATYLRGSDHELTFWNDQYRAAHNFFIQMVYNSGIILLFFMLYLLFMVFKKKASFYYFPYYLFPLLIILMSVSDFGALFFFILLLSTNRMKSTFSDSYKYLRLSYEY